jgi:hypothetical protein
LASFAYFSKKTLKSNVVAMIPEILTIINKDKIYYDNDNVYIRNVAQNFVG